MQLPIYIFSAKQGMQWLSGTSADVVRLDAIRKRIGRLADFDAGESPYRGILADNDNCYVYACFLAPRFDFRGRDATYFIFTEIPKAYRNSLNFDALLRSDLFTQPCAQINECMTFDGARLIKPFALNTTQQDFIGANYWLEKIAPDTEIRFHQEGALTAPVIYSETPIRSPQQSAPQDSCGEHMFMHSSLECIPKGFCTTGTNREVEELRQTIQTLQLEEQHSQQKYQSHELALKRQLQQLQRENDTLQQTLASFKKKNSILQFALLAIVIIIFSLILVFLLYHYYPQFVHSPIVEELEPVIEELVDE